MALGPIDYSSLLTQLDTTPLLQGMALAEEKRSNRLVEKERAAQLQLSRSQFTAEQEKDQRYRVAFSDFLDAPDDEKPLKLLSLYGEFPDRAKGLSDGFGTYEKAQGRAVTSAATRTMGALRAGNIPLARSILTDRKAALEKSGVDTSHTDAALELVTSDDPMQRRRGMGLLATVLVGGIGLQETADLMKQFRIGPEAEFQDRQQTEAERHNRVAEGQGAARVELSQAAGARAAAKSAGRSSVRGGRSSADGDGYEYRVGPGGKLQRRKARGFSNAQLDALIQ